MRNLIILLVITFPLVSYAKPLTPELIREIEAADAWCGTNGDITSKVRICHNQTTGNSGKPKELTICISRNSVRTHIDSDGKGHIGDYFGYCAGDQPDPEPKITIYPCNAGLTQGPSSSSLTVGDSHTEYTSEFNNYITGIVNGRYLSVVGSTNPRIYYEVTSKPFETLLSDDDERNLLTFTLNTNSYGAKYYVDWCISSDISTSMNIKSTFTFSDSRYPGHAELYTKQVVSCGNTVNVDEAFEESTPSEISSTLRESASINTKVNKCILRQYFYETKIGKRPNSGAALTITGFIQVNE